MDNTWYCNILPFIPNNFNKSDQIGRMLRHIMIRPFSKIIMVHNVIHVILLNRKNKQTYRNISMR